MLGEYDTDKDGFISLSEFIGDVRGDGKTTEMILKHICYYIIVNPSVNTFFVIRGFPFTMGD